MPDYTHAKRIIEALELGKTVEVNLGSRWSESAISYDLTVTAGLSEINNPRTYRVKPEPKLIPLSQEDIPPVCWVRENNHCKTHFLTTAVTDDFIWFGSTIQAGYLDLFKHYEYSTDRKSWMPCSKRSV